jgi:hypothetical protein
MSRYHIVLRGRLSERFESAFDGMALEHGLNRTLLVGDIRDQAQLYGRYWHSGPSAGRRRGSLRVPGPVKRSAL